jgi:PAT family beta-lactamase induction signal transducer AmpG
VRSRRFLSLLFLGFSSGLPLYLTSKTLQAWMASSKVDLKSIGLFSLASLPYSLKFLWAPLLDRFRPPFLGRRRGWILICQVLLALAVAAMAFSDPRQSLRPLALAAGLVAFLSASQDIAFEAWRVDVLPEAERGSGASTAVLGYRIALLVTGALALMWADRLGWKVVYLLLALFQGSLALATFLAPEPAQAIASPKSLADAVVKPFSAFVRVRGWGRAAAALAFIALFKWGVYLVSASSTPFLLALGYSNAEVGKVLGGAGLGASIAGTAAGGIAMSRLSVRGALWAFGALQGACGILFWLLALHGRDPPLMAASVISENFFVGMGSAALVAWMIGECDPRYSATQFALLSSLMAFSRDILTSPWGWLSVRLGWPAFYLWTVVACVPGLLLLGSFRKPSTAGP